MEINFSDYLDEREIKSIIIEEFRDQIRRQLKDEKEFERVVGNLAYHLVEEQLKELYPDKADFLKTKVNKILRDESSIKYLIFKTHYLTNEPQSFATRVIEDTVKENEELIKERVKDTLINHDYASEVADQLSNTAEELCGNIYKLGDLFIKK